MSKIAQTIIASIIGTAVIALFGSSGNISEFGVVLGLAAGIIAYFMVGKYSKTSQEEKQKAREEEDKRFENGEMTQAERATYAKKKLDFAEMAYKHGDLTLLQLEVLRKKYTGDSFLIDNCGLEVTAAASNKDQVERAIKQQQKTAERNIILNAAVGDAIGGTAGAIIGAATSAQKSAQEAATLETQRAAAEQNYQKAIKNSVKR